MNKTNKQTFGVSFFLIGLILSPFSSYVFQQVLNLPITFPELIYFPILFFFYKRKVIRFKGKIKFAVLFSIWLLLILFGLIYGRWSLMAILSTARGFFWLFFFFSIGKATRLDESMIDALLYVSIGSMTGWCICSYNMYQEILLGINEIGANYGNMVALAIGFPIIILFKKNNWWLFIVLLLNIFLILTTGLRRQISITVLSLVLSYLLIILRNFDFKKVGILAALIVTIVISYPIIDEKLGEANPLIHHRIIVKTEMLMSGEESNADQTRENEVFKIFEDFDEVLIPHGFVSLKTTKDKGTGVFIDIPTYMLSFIFSIWIFCLYLILYVAKTYNHLLFYIRTKKEECGFVFVVAACMLFLLFVDGTMFTYSYSSALTGLMIGLLFRTPKYL